MELVDITQAQLVDQVDHRGWRRSGRACVRVVVAELCEMRARGEQHVRGE